MVTAKSGSTSRPPSPHMNCHASTIGHNIRGRTTARRRGTGVPFAAEGSSGSGLIATPRGQQNYRSCIFPRFVSLAAICDVPRGATVVLTTNRSGLRGDCFDRCDDLTVSAAQIGCRRGKRRPDPASTPIVSLALLPSVRTISASLRGLLISGARPGEACDHRGGGFAQYVKRPPYQTIVASTTIEILNSCDFHSVLAPTVRAGCGRLWAFGTQGSIYQSVRHVAIGLQGPGARPACDIGVTIVYGGFADWVAASSAECPLL